MEDKELKNILKKFDQLKAQSEKNDKLIKEIEEILKED